MSNYDHTLSITLPAALADIAARIGKALDPDSGGENSFTTSEDGTTIFTSTPCTAEFFEQAQYMLTEPAALHAACAADYAARWTELVAPTLEECQTFCSSIIMDTPYVEPT